MKEKSRYLFFLTIFLSGMFLFQQIGQAKTVQIEVNDLLVRSGAGTTYDLIGHVNEGESYPLLDESEEWLAIDYNGETGWINQQYASIIDQTDVTTSSDHVSDTSDSTNTDDETISLPDTFKIPVDQVNLRKNATTDSEILGTLTQGEKVTIIEQTNQDWIHVNWHDVNGFIPSWLIEQKSHSSNQSDQILQDKIIVIDPGHGGYDVGAISATDNYESHYSLNTARSIKNRLELLGARVYLTREDDFYYALTPRALFANYLAADVFLSLHYNSEPQHPSANGINTYYLNEADQKLAEYVHQGLIEQTDANDREIHTGNYLVLRLTKRPSLLLELGFISNTNEEQNIQSAAYQAQISQGIIDGLENYFLNQ